MAVRVAIPRCDRDRHPGRGCIVSSSDMTPMTCAPILVGTLQAPARLPSCPVDLVKISERRFHDYTVTILRPEGRDAIGESCFEIRKAGKLAYSGTGQRFGMGSLYEDRKSANPLPMGRDITGDGQPDLVISDRTGGAHCGLSFHLFEIGEDFRFIQRIDLGSSDLAEFENLDDDPALELRTGDWTFAYWHASFAESPAPEVILKHTGREYTLAANVMKAPAWEPERLRETAADIRALPDWGSRVPPKLWPAMLERIYSGNLPLAMELLDLAWPDRKSGRRAFLDDFRGQRAKRPY